MVVNEHFFDVQHPGQVLRFSVAPAPYLALVASPRFRRFRVEAGGLTVELLSMSDRYRSPLPESGVGNSLLPADSGDATRWDYQGRLLDTVVRGVSLLEQLGVPLPPGEPVRLIEVPLRLELVSSVPAGILVSDRTYRITPWEAFFRMHDAQVLRALGWLSVASAVKRETRRDQGWIADLLAAATVDAALALGPGDRGPGLRELLRFGAFIPEIDQLLYSPLIQFRHLFLRPFREEDPLREEAWRLANNWPRGAVLHDKLVDLWDQERVQMLLQTYLATEQRLVPLVQSQAGEPMDWFFQQWLGPYPSVNYVVEEQRSEATETGFRHRVVVAREGAAIREPVEILVRYRGGSDEVFRWDGRGPRGVLEFDRAERIQQVVVDPRHRLVEDAQWADNHPRFDNVQPANWRPPVFNGLMVYWSAAENALYGTVDFSLKRQYDVRNSFRLAVDYAPRGLGAALGYYRGLGRLLDTNRASWVTGANLSVLRSFGTFADQEIPATSFGLSLSLSHDTRWYPYDPMEGWGVAMKAYGSGSVTDEGAWGWTVGTSGRVVGHYTPRVGHSFTGYAGAGAVFGEPLAEQLPSISDRAMLRAFEADETLGRVRLYGALEYRWTVVHDLDVNLAHLAWWRALFVALFVGGGTVSERDGLDGLFTASRLFSEVGVGVRTLLTILGAQPYIIAVDVALPITPRQRMRCVADVCAPRNPLGMYVSIQHTL
jgi:hypothetical protein